MPRGSNRFLELKRRLADLRASFLYFLPPPPASKTTYTPQELDLTKAYIVLVHAEIEAYCEDLVRKKAVVISQRFHRTGAVSPALRRIVAYYVGKNRKDWTEVISPSGQTVNSALQSFLDHIRNNNGIKRDNLEPLFYPLGLSELTLGITWLAQMDSFGVNRGGWAHNTSGALNPPDPASELATTNQILIGLLSVDRALSRLR